MKKQIYTKVLALSILYCSAFLSAGAQPVCLNGQSSLGGTGDDMANYIIDYRHGFIVCGSTNSRNGDFRVPVGHQADAYVAKYYSLGNLEWTRTYGGGLNDGFMGIASTNDGGLIAIGYTSSMDNNGSGNHGGTDVWVVKLNPSGGILWQKTYGGTGLDKGFSIVQNPSGNYTFIAMTNSTDGDVAFNHGGLDIWVVNINQSGQIIWQQSYGGSKDDWPNRIIQMQDGSYIFSGNTTSNDGDITKYWGGQDAFTVKINSFGRIIWSRNNGGSRDDFQNSFQETADGNILLVNGTTSNDGDVDGEPTGGTYKAWLIKLDSRTGGWIWSKTYPNPTDAVGGGFVPAPDGGGMVLAVTMGKASDNTTSDEWDFLIDAYGNNGWETIYGGNGNDEVSNYGIREPSGSVIIACQTTSTEGIIRGNHGGEESLIVEIGPCKEIKSAPAALLSSSPVSCNPNPFVTSTMIKFNLDQAGQVTAQVYNMNGQLVATVADGEFDKGTHQVELGAQNLKAGLYFLKFRTPGGVQTEKLIVSK